MFADSPSPAPPPPPTPSKVKCPVSWLQWTSRQIWLLSSVSKPTTSPTEVGLSPPTMASCDVINFLFLNLRTVKNAFSGLFGLQGHQPLASSFYNSTVTEYMPFWALFTSRAERVRVVLGSVWPWWKPYFFLPWLFLLVCACHSSCSVNPFVEWGLSDLITSYSSKHALWLSAWPICTWASAMAPRSGPSWSSYSTPLFWGPGPSSLPALHPSFSSHLLQLHWKTDQ